MKAIATTVLCLLPLAGCSGWVVIISPSGVSCASNVIVISVANETASPADDHHRRDRARHALELHISRTSSMWR